MLSNYLYYLGKNCESNINDCIVSPCANGGTCIDETDRFVCNCADGFEGIYIATYYYYYYYYYFQYCYQCTD